MELQPHQQRVVEEAEQLDDKITKLEAFLKSDKVSVVDGQEVTLLGTQLQAMKNYSDLLHARISYWGNK